MYVTGTLSFRILQENLFRVCSLELTVLFVWVFGVMHFLLLSKKLTYEDFTSDLVDSACACIVFSLTDVALQGCSFAICSVPGTCLAFSSFLRGITLFFGEISLQKLCMVSVPNHGVEPGTKDLGWRSDAES